MGDIQTAVYQLAQDCSFEVKQLVQDDQHFGNALIVASISNLDVRFVRDRGAVWCEMLIPSHPAEWYFFEDVMNALHIPVTSGDVDLVATMKANVGHLHQHLSHLIKAFGPDHVVETRHQVDQLVRRRVLDKFGFRPKDKP